MTLAKTIVLIVGSEWDLNREAHPGRLVCLSVDLKSRGDFGFQSQTFATKESIVDEKDTRFPEVRGRGGASFGSS